MTDRIAKLDRIRVILDAHGSDRLELTCGENLAWLLDGARVAVPLGGPPIMTATVHRDGLIEVTAFGNETDRLAAEELPADVVVTSAPWHRPLPRGGGLSDVDLVDELRAARARLLPTERSRFASLGAELAALTTRTLRSARQEESERALAGRLAAGIIEAGAEPVVLLVAGEARRRLRHPLPTAAALGDRAMVAVGARRHGLVASLTRWIDFRGDALSSVDRALLEVEADAFAATRPGRRLSAVLDDIRASYDRNGLGADAWLGHHQGGPTGYLGRDPKATPETHDIVIAGQAFAWNPSAPGAKVEDTVVVDDDGLSVLTVDPGWPAVEVRGVPRPLPLVPDTHPARRSSELDTEGVR